MSDYCQNFAVLGGSFQLPSDGFMPINADDRPDTARKGIEKSASVQTGSAQYGDLGSKLSEKLRIINTPPRKGTIPHQIRQAIAAKRNDRRFYSRPAWFQEVLFGIGTRWDNEPLPVPASWLAEDLSKLRKLSKRREMHDILFWKNIKPSTKLFKIRSSTIHAGLDREITELDDKRVSLKLPPTMGVRNWQPASSNCAPVNENENHECMTEYSGDESVDTESIWTSEYSEDVPELDYGHPLWSIISGAVQKTVEAFLASSPSQDDDHIHQVPGGQSDTRQGTCSAGGSSLESGQSNAMEGSRKKRARSAFSQGEEAEDENGNGGQNGQSQQGKGMDSDKPCFACPFAKANPLKHNDCNSYKLTRIRDVKQHLFRRHKLPIYCPRCKETFGTEADRDEHGVSAIPCTASSITVEGINDSQREQLQKSSRDLDPKAKWFEMFKILFPGHRLPTSAYKDANLSAKHQGYQDYMHDVGPDILLSYLNEHSPQLVSIPGYFPIAPVMPHILRGGIQEITRQWQAVTGTTALELPDDSIDSSSGPAETWLSNTGNLDQSCTVGTNTEDGLLDQQPYNYQLNPATNGNEPVQNRDATEHNAAIAAPAPSLGTYYDDIMWYD
ncbi:hypothetical protein QQS21_000728 [Conoideocrella luteorostrata]|uniref:Uncharacterized protein n=1 Tax=Conoideocrella luteorostrata TaxID=1105319 RepID=A0AAJ0FY67_9HYPO|nr:hypothetical protein QQS21_000728 [Conoideocrella luteorostrata]